MYQPNLIYSTGPTQSNPGVQDLMGLGNGAMVPQNGGNNNPNMGARQRLRWTNELHDRFVEAVTQLGGPDSMLFVVQLVFLVFYVFPFLCGVTKCCLLSLLNKNLTLQSCLLNWEIVFPV
jgi:hypothetical protein